MADQAELHEVAVLAGGCFWCTEAVFLDLSGVKSVESGYIGGDTVNPPTSRCARQYGHAALRITFDPSRSSTRDLVIFFATHVDPSHSQAMNRHPYRRRLPSVA